MYSALAPVAEAVFALLSADATLAAALPGGVHGVVKQGTSFPFLWVEAFDELDIRGLGTGGLPELDLRLHTYSKHGSMSEAQDANRIAIGLLRDAALTITGYTQAGRATYRKTVVLRDEELNGVPVHEVVSLWTVWADEVAA